MYFNRKKHIAKDQIPEHGNLAIQIFLLTDSGRKTSRRAPFLLSYFMYKIIAIILQRFSFRRILFDR